MAGRIIKSCLEKPVPPSAAIPPTLRIVGTLCCFARSPAQPPDQVSFCRAVGRGSGLVPYPKSALPRFSKWALTGTLIGTATLLGGCIPAGERPNRGYSDYDHNRPDPAYGGYDADRYYRDDPNYQGRRLSDNDRVYRGRDGRYYCRRDNGTTGLIVGGVAGGILGNIIAPGGSALLGTILGAVGGGVAGKAIDKSDAKDGYVCK